ncbi:hypothetical protein QQ045_011398 [Rhodiola kirilowii]
MSPESILAETIECSTIKSEVVNYGNKLADSQCRGLICKVTDKEVWSVLSKIGVDKSPRPDGFSTSFFKKNWSLLGKELCSGIRHCLKYNALPKGLNAAFIALVPKSNLAIKPGDFRPIYCYNVVYKQLVSGYSRKNISERMAWKIDLRKAYDTVNWKFIRAMLNNLNFPLKFIKWIVMCVESTSFSVQINGELVDYFDGNHGLRQGDPISPLLFTIVMEYLSRLLKGLNKDSGFYHHPKCHRVDLKHIIFADDLFLFSSGRCSAITTINDVLKEFLACSGLSVNVDKSQIFTSGRCCHLLSWEKVCLDKKDGGFEIKNMNVMNEALVLNQLWDLNKEGQHLWIKWVHAYWTKGTHWWENESLTNSSWVLRRLAACKRISWKCVSVENDSLKWIGEGTGFTVNDTVAQGICGEVLKFLKSLMLPTNGTSSSHGTTTLTRIAYN